MCPSRYIYALITVLIVIMFTTVIGCSKAPENPTPDSMRPVTASREEVPDDDTRRIAELSDVRVKLRRNKDGTYSYEISGKNAESVIDADRKLDEYVSGRDKSKR